MLNSRQLVHGLVLGASFILVALSLVFGTVGGPHSPEPLLPEKASRPPAIHTAWRDFRPEFALGYATYLCQEIGPRPAGGVGEKRAATYLTRQLKRLGYQVEQQGPLALGKPKQHTTNIIGRVAKVVDGPRVIIGAHYDTVSGQVPGANDNASGVAVVLEIARLLAGKSLPYTPEFVFFGGEERQASGASLTGSRGYVCHIKKPVAAMINVDMVGRGEQLYAWVAAGHSNYLTSLLTRSATALTLPLRAGKEDPASDHSSFARAGIPAIWVQCLPDERNHTPGDRIERLSATALERAGRLVMHTLVTLESEDITLLLRERYQNVAKANHSSSR